MPIQVACPACKQRFNAPDASVGKKAKCPKCGGAIVISAVQAAPLAPPPKLPPVTQKQNLFSAAVAPAAPVFDDEDLERGPVVQDESRQKRCPVCGEMIQASAVKCRFCGEVLDQSMAKSLGVAVKKKAKKGNWLKTRTGLSIVQGSTIGLFLVIIAVYAIAWIIRLTIGPQPPGTVPASVNLLLLFGGLAAACCGIGNTIGQLMCVTVPPNSGARGYAYGTAICVVLSTLGSLLTAVTPREQLQGVLPLILIGALASMIGQVLFLLFIRRCAVYLGDRDLPSSVIGFFIYSVALLPVTIVIFIAVAPLRSVAAIILVGIAFLCGMVFGFFWYVSLIGSLVEIIDGRAR